MTIPGEAWKDRGNCATEDGKYLVYFMPDFSGYYTRRGESKERAIAKATAMCKAGCPVMDECEAYRRYYRIVWGIWAGRYHAPTRGTQSRSRADRNESFASGAEN